MYEMVPGRIRQHAFVGFLLLGNLDAQPQRSSPLHRNHLQYDPGAYLPEDDLIRVHICIQGFIVQRSWPGPTE